MSDAFGSLRRSLRAHLAFNALCALAFVLWVVLLAFLFGRIARLNGPSANGLRAVLTLVFLLLSFVPLPMAALHRGFSVAVSIADLRGAPIRLSRGIAHAVRRLPTHALLVLTRLVFDLPVACLLFGVLAAIGGVVDRANFVGANDSIRAIEMLALYVLWCGLVSVWMLAVRAFLGLAHAVAETEEGFHPHTAASGSSTLLEGRRLKLVGLRAFWGLIVVVLLGVLYSPPFIAKIATNGAEPTEGGSPAMLLYLPVAYFGIFLLYAFDGVLESAFYMRATSSLSSEGVLASVFE